MSASLCCNCARNIDISLFQYRQAWFRHYSKQNRPRLFTTNSYTRRSRSCECHITHHTLIYLYSDSVKVASQPGKTSKVRKTLSKSVDTTKLFLLCSFGNLADYEPLKPLINWENKNPVSLTITDWQSVIPWLAFCFSYEITFCCLIVVASTY